MINKHLPRLMFNHFNDTNHRKNCENRTKQTVCEKRACVPEEVLEGVAQ